MASVTTFYGGSFQTGHIPLQHVQLIQETDKKYSQVRFEFVKNSPYTFTIRFGVRWKTTFLEPGTQFVANALLSEKEKVFFDPIFDRIKKDLSELASNIDIGYHSFYLLN